MKHWNIIYLIAISTSHLLLSCQTSSPHESRLDTYPETLIGQVIGDATFLNQVKERGTLEGHSHYVWRFHAPFLGQNPFFCKAGESANGELTLPSECYFGSEIKDGLVAPSVKLEGDYAKTFTAFLKANALNFPGFISSTLTDGEKINMRIIKLTDSAPYALKCPILTSQPLSQTQTCQLYYFYPY